MECRLSKQPFNTYLTFKYNTICLKTVGMDITEAQRSWLQNSYGCQSFIWKAELHSRLYRYEHKLSTLSKIQDLLLSREMAISDLM